MEKVELGEETIGGNRVVSKGTRFQRKHGVLMLLRLLTSALPAGNSEINTHSLLAQLRGCCARGTQHL